MKLGRTTAVLGAAVWASLACSSSPFRGGYTRPEAHLAGTRTTARFLPGRCADRTGRELGVRFTSLELVETLAGRPLLLEHRPGHELLVIENAYDDGAFLMFELIVNGAHVRRYRLPRQAGVGWLELGNEFREAREGDAFRATLARASLTCSLLREGAQARPAARAPTP